VPAGVSGHPLERSWFSKIKFVSSNSTGLSYAVFQTNGWTGSLSPTFELSEASAVVQTMTAGTSVGKQQASSAFVLNVAATISQSSYVGPGVLTATTTVTPNTGRTPFSLKAYLTLQLGGAGTRRVVQAFVGNLANNSGFPCAGLPCGLPANAVAVQPDQFPQSHTAGAYYAVVQARRLVREPRRRFEVTEAGSVVQTLPLGGFIAPPEGQSALVFSTSVSPLPGKYVGQAILSLTSAASPAGGHTPFTLTSYSPLQVQLGERGLYAQTADRLVRISVAPQARPCAD
jgi:hypothetical protein